MKHDLIRNVALSVGMNQRKTQEIIQTALDEMVKMLAADGKCQLLGFGTFHMKQRGPRNISDPRTLKQHKVPGQFFVTFNPGSEMQNMMFVKYLQASTMGTRNESLDRH